MGLLTDCPSEFATDGDQLDDGCGEHWVSERLRERAALVRVCFHLSYTSWLTKHTDFL